MMRPEIFKIQVKGLGMVSAEDFEKDWVMKSLICVGGIVWNAYTAPVHTDIYLANVFLT